SRLGIDREYDPGAAEVGPDHRLNPYRKRDLQMIETFGFAVADRAVREEGCVTTPTGREKLILASHVKECFLLSGKAGGREILRRRTGAHCHGHVFDRGAPRELTIGFPDRCGDLLGPYAAEERAPHRKSRLYERCHTALEVVECGTNDVTQPVRIDEAPVCIGRGCKSWRHQNAFSLQVPQQLAR